MPVCPNHQVHAVVPLACISGCVQVVLFIMPGHKGAVSIDASGRSGLAICRALGIASSLAVAHAPAAASLQDRAAAKKAAASALAMEVRATVCLHMRVV